MDNAVWEGQPESHTRHDFTNHNNAYEINHGIHKACRYLSAPNVACERHQATSEASFESDSDSDCGSDIADSPRMTLACVGFDLERPDKGKGAAV